MYKYTRLIFLDIVNIARFIVVIAKKQKKKNKKKNIYIHNEISLFKKNICCIHLKRKTAA